MTGPYFMSDHEGFRTVQIIAHYTYKKNTHFIRIPLDIRVIYVYNELVKIKERGKSMKVSELKRLLLKNHCKCIGQYNGHEKWYSPITGKTFPIPRHDAKEIPTGTLNKILKDAGLK